MHQSVNVSTMPYVLLIGVKTGVEPCLTVSQTVVRTGTLSPQLSILKLGHCKNVVACKLPNVYPRPLGVSYNRILNCGVTNWILTNLLEVAALRLVTWLLSHN